MALTALHRLSASRAATGADQPVEHSLCVIKQPWLRRIGLTALLFYCFKGLFWLALWWWLS